MSTDLVLRNAEMERVQDVPGVASVEAKPRAGGVQVIVKFDNGFGASVIQNPYSYGGTQGLWELAVLDATGDLTHGTPVTDDVLGHLSGEDVIATLRRIAELESTAAPHDSADCAPCDDAVDSARDADQADRLIGGGR